MNPADLDEPLPDLTLLFIDSSPATVSPACVLEARDRAQLDALARNPRLRPMLLGRVSDRYLVVDPDCAGDVAAALRAGGFVVVMAPGATRGGR